jgi:hypothetical protein
VEIEYRLANNEPERLPELAAAEIWHGADQFMEKTQ